MSTCFAVSRWSKTICPQCNISTITVSYRIHHPKISPVPHQFNLTPLKSLLTTDLSTIFIVLPFRECQILQIRTTQHSIFSDWSFTWQYVFKIHQCFCMAGKLLSFYCWIVFHSTNEGLISCFPFWVIMNEAALNIHLKVFRCI